MCVVHCGFGFLFLRLGFGRGALGSLGLSFFELLVEHSREASWLERRQAWIDQAFLVRDQLDHERARVARHALNVKAKPNASKRHAGAALDVGPCGFLGTVSFQFFVFDCFRRERWKIIVFLRVAPTLSQWRRRKTISNATGSGAAKKSHIKSRTSKKAKSHQNNSFSCQFRKAVVVQNMVVRG